MNKHLLKAWWDGLNEWNLFASQTPSCVIQYYSSTQSDLKTQFFTMVLKLNSVLITDEVDPKCVAILESNGVKVTMNTKLAKDKAAMLAEIPVSTNQICAFTQLSHIFWIMCIIISLCMCCYVSMQNNITRKWEDAPLLALAVLWI